MKRIYFLSVALFFNVITMVGCNAQSEDRPAEQNAPSIEEKIGQMIMVGFKGFEVSDTSHVVRDIEEYNVGGIILFDYDMTTRTPNRNIESPTQVKELTTKLQELSETPLFMAIDQEGGRVARLKTDRGFASHASAHYIGITNNTDTTRFYASKMADQLQDLGFNVNFAPVVDLNVNPDNPVIGQLDRSFGASPGLVVEHAEIYLDEFNKHNILGVLKHFPGHGSAWNDSHVGMADVTDTWEPIELEPYRQLADSDLPFAVMTAHVLNKNIDPDLPATLSAKAQTEMLRDDIGFDGVLFSDDMQMEAIRSFYGLDASVKHAINAGVDVLVFANNSVYQPDIVPDIINIVLKLIDEGEIEQASIDESYNRIMRTKNELSLR
ncbi:MAG TPA: glycoside hydrolase family 3 N-terminal domain-containing protein [Balneolaceae bacterium]|nr:glycoside hydrolase family 3 N-terminal domain-containing protein [Balneolaceae bacterium]